MSAQRMLTFKVADQPGEMEAIHRLNHRTFCEEIPQHSCNDTGWLVDKFHTENTYVIAQSHGQLVGMVALRGRRPFSLDAKIPDLESHLPPGRRWCEIRLLAVEKAVRFGPVTTGLLGTLAREALRQGYDAALISGTTRQIKLYERIGFTTFGPLVGTADAAFQPMYLSLESFQRHSRMLHEKTDRPLGNFLPGPVALTPAVREAFARLPESHRSHAFHDVLAETVRHLQALTQARHVQLLTGSGTLANEAIAAQIFATGEPGLILSQGEFGERLADHATRWNIPHHKLTLPCGEALQEATLRAHLTAHPDARWLWATHCETSTSTLNPLPLLQRLCTEHHVKLCLDAISTLGVIPLDLSQIWLASAASGKGLASYPGLALVFYNHPIIVRPHSLPRYLDLGYYALQQGVPFTLNSNLLHALATAVTTTDWPAKYARIARHSQEIHHALHALGHPPLLPPPHANPAVITLPLPPGISSRNLGWRFQQAGFLLSHESAYLLEKNWLQICLMGDLDTPEVTALINTATQLLPRPLQT